ncbi:MAG: dTMP kinase [Betaproteobacteria bacterium]
MMTGRFITFEGIDGAGKSSHIGRLADWLKGRGHEVVVSREPGGTPLAEALRDLVLHRSMDAMTEALLVFAARRDHVQQQIRPALEAGSTVLCDRFTDATFAYQGGGRGFDLTVLDQLEAWVQEGLQPDLTLWFDLPPRVAAQRRTAARAADRFEAEEEAFFERVRQGYQRRCQAQPARFAVLDAERTPEQVWGQVARTLESRGW